MSWLQWKRAGTDAKPVDNPSLREKLDRDPVLIKNYDKEKFFCKAAVDELMTPEAISAWKKTDALHRDSDIGVDEDDLVDRIARDHRHRQLFAILVATKLERFTFAVLNADQSGEVFPNIKYEDLDLDPSQRQRLNESLRKLSPVFSEGEHKNLSSETVLPFTERENTDLKGSFGKIYRVKIADGHLEKYTQKVVAVKQVYIDDDNKQDICRREVDTLHQRKHANIVPLLASYFMKTRASDSVPSLHLIFPFADGGNLHAWMNTCVSPGWLQNVSPQKRDVERRRYLYRNIHALLTGLSFIHGETDGTITSHHDLKPENILVFGKELKIADFGRSHLHARYQGSETDVNSGLGTYMYQPPEYWTVDGRRADVKHGRRFDIYSMGCIILELATLIAYGWESKKVEKFRKQREENITMPKAFPKDHGRYDASFHNNPNTVKEWIQQLKSDDESKKMDSTLKMALQMMDENRYNRLYAWEAELDFDDIQNPDDDRDMREKRTASRIQGPPPQWKIPEGTQTPPHRAAHSGNLTRFVQLCEAGWSLDATNSAGLTPWRIIERNYPERCNDLRARLGPLAPGKAGSNKVASEKAPVRKELEEQKGHELLEAAARDDLNTVRDLIDNGVDTLFADNQNRTALFKAVEKNRCSVAEYLLQVNGEKLLQLKDERWSDTPLHKAASMGHVAMIKCLLPYCSDTEEKQKEGKTALFLAVEWDHPEVVDVLLQHEAQVFTQRDTKGTPLHAAAQWNRQRILRQLLSRAPDVEKCLEHKNQWGDTPLWFALSNRNVECADILLEHGASLHVANNDRANVIHIAVWRDLYDFLVRTVNRFRRDEFQSRDKENNTPLGVARRKNKPRFIKLLTPYTDRV